MDNSLCAHTRPLARGKVIPKMLRRSINTYAHRVTLAHEMELRRELIEQAQQMLADGLITDDIVAALGLAGDDDRKIAAPIAVNR